MNYFETNTDESKLFYTKQLRTRIRSLGGRQKFIWGSNATRLAKEVYELIRFAQVLLEEKKYETAFYISAAVLEQLTKALAYSDDSSGMLSDRVKESINVMQQIANSPLNETFRKMLFTYLIKAFEKKLFDEWDWHIEMIELAALLISTSSEKTTVLNLLADSDKTSWQRNRYQVIEYGILLRSEGKDIAEIYLNKHLSNPELRELAIKNALEINHFEKAVTLANQAINQNRNDKDKWNIWLLTIAQQQQDTPKIIEYARTIFIETTTKYEECYRFLKNKINVENWVDFRKDLIKNLDKNNSWINENKYMYLYINECMWPELLEFLQKEKSIKTILVAEKYLIDDYADELAILYSLVIKDYLIYNVSRKHYKHMCKFIKKMLYMGQNPKLMS